jgi:hypothetical protein
MKNPSWKLANILIGKAIIETLLVGALAVGFYFTAFPPTFHGWGEAQIQSKSIVGWAVNNASPWQRVEVQLFVDEKFVAARTAELSRPDVRNAGWSQDEWHGYSFQLNDFAPGIHFAKVYAVHKSGGGTRYTLQLLGDPIMFSVAESGSWHQIVTTQGSDK